MFPTLQFGPLALPVPPLAIILSLWLGLSLTEKFAKKRSLNADALYNLTFIALISGIIGARLFFAVQNFSAFVQTPLSLFSRETGSLDPFGGFASALLAALVYGRRARLEFWPTLDGLTPLFAVLAVGLGFSRLASGAGFGMETSAPWGIELWGAIRHPTQVYEIGLALAILLGLGWVAADLATDLTTDSVTESRRETDEGTDLTAGKRMGGRLFLLFVALTAGAQLFVEGFRGDSTLLPGGIRVGQALAWLVMATALWEMKRKRA
jgi:phosphatidylglycerol---prolipoprotein diacylglyceryl transferase